MNQILIARDDNDYLSKLQICIVQYQIHLRYRVVHHQKTYHHFKKYHMKRLDNFESCLMYQNYEMFQDFVQYFTECEERANVLEDNMESNNFDVYETFSNLCQKFIHDFRRLVINFERTKTKSFQFT